MVERIYSLSVGFFALPIPFILINAPVWGWVVFANILLGINQVSPGASTVVMKIDLVGEKDRGFAMDSMNFRAIWQ